MTELVAAVLTRPTLDLDEAAEILRGHWAIAGVLRDLPSERDRNVAVRVDGVDRYVLKVANATEDRAFLDLQHRAMDRLAAAGVPCQRVVPTTSDEEVVDLGAAGTPRLARVLTWLPGRPLATIPAATRPRELLVDLGRVMGTTVAALDGYDHPAAHRSFQWSAEDGLAVIAAHAGAVTDRVRADLLARWQTRLLPLADRLPRLRQGLIHNDANDHNVLVADDGRSISGLLDLGDAIWSVRVQEPAVAAAYAALATADADAVIEAVAEGFSEASPMTDSEQVVLRELVALRLATSVVLSAHQSRLAPDDPYLTVSEAPAWALLERLIAVEPAR